MLQQDYIRDGVLEAGFELKKEAFRSLSGALSVSIVSLLAGFEPLPKLHALDGCEVSGGASCFRPVDQCAAGAMDGRSRESGAMPTSQAWTSSTPYLPIVAAFRGS